MNARFDATPYAKARKALLAEDAIGCARLSCLKVATLGNFERFFGWFAGADALATAGVRAAIA